MASEIRVNQIQNRSGLSTVTFSDTGVVISGITTIGILSVTGNLNVTGSNGLVVAAGSAAAPSISPSGDSNTGIFFPAPDTVAIAEGGVEALRVDSSGRVGIATNNPTSTLDVGGEVTIRRTAPGNEGGQLNLARASDNASAWYLDVYGSTSTPDLRVVDATAAAVRMQIDGSGRMTIPSQPAFQAYSTTNASVASGTTVLPFNATNFNIGSHYNTSTYRFTAPIAGRYLFSVNLNLYNTPGIMMPGVRINGSSLYHGNRLTGNINGDNNLNAIVILSLSVNDYVEAMSSALGSSSTLSNGATWTRFEGYLIG